MFVCSQSEVQLKGEVAVRNQLLHAMAEQQNLMDALTAVSVLFTLYMYMYMCLWSVYIHVHVHVHVRAYAAFQRTLLNFKKRIPRSRVGFSSWSSTPLNRSRALRYRSFIQNVSGGV